MIVWVNCKITNIRKSSYIYDWSPDPRWGLRTHDRIDIFKYSLASMSPLDPLVVHWIFNIDLAGDVKHRQEELEDWIKNNFPKDKTTLLWYRCNNLKQWGEIKDFMDTMTYDLIYPAGNDDYIFMDTDIEYLRRGLDHLRRDPDPDVSMMICHYPEIIGDSYKFAGDTRTDDGLYGVYKHINPGALQIMKRSHFENYLDYNRGRNGIVGSVGYCHKQKAMMDPDGYIYILEHLIHPGRSRLYSPTRELFRHFDGYNHVRADPNICPPIEIPSGFFDKSMTIRYGFDLYNYKSVNLNPKSNLFTVDKVRGADYKFCLEDIPIFWKPYIKDIITNDAADINELKICRNRHMLQLARSQNPDVPESWISQHYLT